MPFADVLYFADSEWWEWQTKGKVKPVLGLSADDVRARFAAFAGQKCSIQQSGGNITDPDVHIMRNRHFPQHGTGISLDPEYLITGSHSGHQAFNAAILGGARVVALLGMDGAPAADGKRHFFGNHPRVEPETVYPLMVKAFRAGAAAVKAAGVRVVNCSPTSAIDCFEKMPIEAALAL